MILIALTILPNMVKEIPVRCLYSAEFATAYLDTIEQELCAANVIAPFNSPVLQKEMASTPLDSPD